MNTRELMNEEAKSYGIEQGNDFFQFEKSGTYKIRLLTAPSAIATHFFGKGQPSPVCFGTEKGCPFHDEFAPKDDKGNPKKPSLKFMSYVIDRKDGKVRLGELPWSVVGAVADLEEQEDWAFQSYPMPYDITVKVDKENNDPKQIYKTFGVPTRSDLTLENENELSERMQKLNVADFIQRRKDKALKVSKENGSWDKAAEARKARMESKDVASNEIQYPEDEINPADIPF